MIKILEILLLALNNDKCKVMHVGKKNPLHNYSIPDQSSTSISLLAKTLHEKDLGVTISHYLKQQLQCQKAAAKASSMLGLIKRTIISRDELIN